MKHSIKREQSHARMSFAEFENQRSLAEGESNVRATLKHMKLSFHLILTLAVMLTMAQTAWATDNETKTFTLSSVTGSSNPLSYDGKVFLSAQFGTVGKGSFISMSTPSSGKVGTIRLYPRISGKVKSLSFSSAQVMMIDSNGGGYVKIGKSSTNNWTNSISQEQISWGSLSFTNASGIQLENEKDYLEIELYNPVRNCNFNMQGTLTITYEPTPSNLTHEHDFTYEVTNSGNTLTATCGEGDELTCTLTNRQISTTIKADNAVANGLSYVALLPDFGLFQTETGATKGDFTYKNKGTNENLGTTGPTQTGYYTASIVITAGGTNHTLSKDFHLGTFCSINPNYPQFTTDKDGNYAMDGETVTLTFTSKFGETLTGVTATGATSGSDITLTTAGANTYTFTMPAEGVNIGATFSAPDVSNFEQNGDTYTIKTANGWGWFCFATNYDLAPEGFSGKIVKLDADVSSSEMAGKSGQPFKGTFDGQNYTLTFNRTAAEHLSAPFHYINGATISNLHVEGTITGGTYESLGGLVGHSEGNITINNCHVSTEISTTVSGSALHGGVIAQWNGTNATCTVTGCVYDGLIYKTDEAGVTTSCRGFIGWDYGNNGTITFTDCLSAPAAYGTGKYALGDNCFTFVYPNSEPTLTYNMTNCYYTSILGNRQGRPAATATVAPANLGNATTDHGMVDGYENGFLYNGNYYTPKYGDAVVEYRFNDWNERADVTINGTSENLVGVNITEEVGNIKSVTYNRPFNTAQAATVILPFNYTCNGSEGGKFYSFAGFNGTTPIMEDGNQVTSLTANTPYLFVPTASTMTFPNITNMTNGIMTLQPTTGDYDATSDDGVWKLVGSYNGKTWEENDPEIGKAYVYNANGELFPVTAGTRIRPTECYIIQTKKLMTGTDITVSIPSVEWTGSEIAFDETAVVVKDGETTLTLTTDYTVTAPTGTLQDTGDYPVTITGAGEYAGEVVAMFTIKGKPVTVKNDKNEDVPAATGDAEITQDQDGLTLTLTTPTESTTPHTVNVPQPVEVDHVSIDRTFEAGKACTLYLPFSIAADKIAGGTFNTFTGVDTSNPTEWIVLYSPVAGDIEANTPYIFLPNGTNGGKITVNNGSDKVSICTANPHTTEKDQWDFIGTYERIKWTHNTSDPEYDSYREAEIGSIYGFAAEEKSGATVGQFVQVTDNVWINPMRAYLKHTVVAPARSMDGNAATTELPSSMKVVIVEGTTGITSMEDVRGKMSDAWYSLDGRKLQGKPTTKGMYIHNGRKEVVK